MKKMKNEMKEIFIGLHISFEINHVICGIEEQSEKIPGLFTKELIQVYVRNS